MTPPDDGTGAAILRWALAAVSQYSECRDKHRALVDAWPR